MNPPTVRFRHGFTLIEVFTVVLIIGFLIGLLLPAVQSAREMARRTSCANNLMQVSLAVSAYHHSFDHLPVQLSGTDGSTKAEQDNDRRLSIFVAILPFADRRNMADQIRSSLPKLDESDFGYLDDMGDYWDDDSFADEPLEDEQDEDSEEVEFWVAGGPEPSVNTYLPWRTEVPVLRCPSDPGYGSEAGRTNYAVCLGDAVIASATGPMKEDATGVFVIDAELAKQTEASMRGAFVPRAITCWSDFRDGRSNTILLGEILTDVGDEDNRTYPIVGPDLNEAGVSSLRDEPNWARTSGAISLDEPLYWRATTFGSKLSGVPSARRGLRWADGMPLYTTFNTILPPNQPITLSEDRDDTWGILPPSSRHQGGAQIALADGSIRFISDTVEAGDPSQPTVYEGSENSPGSQSPYGVWGAMGTRASSEIDRL
ncbi:MAG: DUF1559 domain-containing protein [Planctomycetota bacterium]